MGAFPEIYACPRCGRLLVQSGEAVVEDVRLPVFQCDECRVVIDLAGDKAEAALTITLDEDGQPFDATATDGWRWT
jgi:hypothetical protein